MKSLVLSLLTILLVVGFGCASSTMVASAESPKGPVELTLDGKNDTVRVELGESNYKLHLRGITDSRCPANAKCIWQGELAAEIEVDSDQSGRKGQKRITLGQVTTPSVTALGASFELVSISERSVTLRMTAE